MKLFFQFFRKYHFLYIKAKLFVIKYLNCTYEQNFQLFKKLIKIIKMI